MGFGGEKPIILRVISRKGAVFQRSAFGVFDLLKWLTCLVDKNSGVIRLWLISVWREGCLCQQGKQYAG